MSIVNWLTPFRVVLGLLLVGIGALAVALTAQYGFDLWPCSLCLYQRVPYGMMAVVCALALLFRRSERAFRNVIKLCVVLMFAQALLALYHTGVEQHWWRGPDGCTGSGVLGVTAEQLPNLFDAPPPARCDEIPWTLFGLSMATWNMLFGVMMAVLLDVYLRLLKWKRENK